MSFCQVIKGNNRPCCNYARKGLTCCYAHRKLETEPCAVIEPDQTVKVPVLPPVDKIETFEITPWDDDDLWEQIIEVAYQGAEAFVDGLDWVALCSGCYKGPAQFVFHKSLASKHVDCIIKNQGELYSAEMLTDGKLSVYVTII